ncbi:MAG: hypothetical protein ACLPQS_11030 [Acidimicrobiales bacterium]
MIWQKTYGMLTANPVLPSPPYLFGVMTDLYMTSQATAVRRECEGKGRRDRNTCRLLHELRVGASSIRRDWYCSIYPADPIMQGVANITFDRVSRGGESLAVEWIEGEAALLTRVSKGTREFVDKRIAHPDHGAEIEIPTMQDLDLAIDALGEVDRALHLLLLGADFDGPEPYVLFDWAAGLEVPWYVPPSD